MEAGGETIFPRAGNLPDLHEKRDCDKMGGIRVPPKQVSQSSGREGEGRCGAGCWDARLRHVGVCVSAGPRDHVL